MILKPHKLLSCLNKVILVYVTQHFGTAIPHTGAEDHLSQSTNKLYFQLSKNVRAVVHY